LINGTDEDGVAYEMIIGINSITNEKNEIFKIRQDCNGGETVSKIIGYQNDIVYYIDSNFIIYSSKINSTERNYLANLPNIYDAIFTIDDNTLVVQYKIENSKDYKELAIEF
jgi:hypothetical protein